MRSTEVIFNNLKQLKIEIINVQSKLIKNEQRGVRVERSPINPKLPPSSRDISHAHIYLHDKLNKIEKDRESYPTN